jgi:hypothetical protein
LWHFVHESQRQSLAYGQEGIEESWEIYTRILTIVKGVKGFWQRSLSCVREYRYNDNNLFGDSVSTSIDAYLAIKVWKEDLKEKR